MGPDVIPTQAETGDRSRAVRPAAGLAVVVFLGVTAGVQMSDRGLHAILSPAIRQSFGVGDAVMGSLHGVAGILVASALALPLARLADRHARTRILIGLIVCWTALTILCGLAPTFPLFFLGRAASGVTEFAMIPIVYSLIPDLVSERWRRDANLAFAAIMAVGASAGFYFGGTLPAATSGLDLSLIGGPREDWRTSLVLLGLAGLPLALVATFIREPPRRVAAGTDGGSAGDTGSLLRFAATHRREVLLFMGAAGGLAVAVQALAPMAAMAIARRFPIDLDTIGHGLGVVTLITSLGSLPAASLVDRVLGPRFGHAARPAIMMAAALLAIPCALALGAAGSTLAAMAAVGAFLAATCLGNALIPTMLQDLIPAPVRARGFAAYSFLISAFCALGPVLSGLISDQATGGDLMRAITIAAIPALALAAACAGLSATGFARTAKAPATTAPRA